jgi:two-component system, response regulator FlrC
MVKILIVEDKKLLREALGQVIERYYGSFDAVADSSKALKCLALNDYDLVISDNNMVRANEGLELMVMLEARYPDVKRILTSGVLMSVDDPMDYCAHAFLEKPYELSAVRDTIDSLLAER